MREYFELQFRMSQRTLREFGINPCLGYILLLAGFTGLSYYLFLKTEFAQYLLVLISLVLTSGLSEVKRNDFLRMCFSASDYHIVRTIENLLASALFIIFLAYRQCFISSALLACMTVILGLWSYRSNLNFTTPTPFYRRPFEFIVGFRNSFFVFPLAWVLTVIAISVDNFNLGMFSLIAVFVTILCYYLKPEDEYYVWSFAMKPGVFLKKKIHTAIIYSGILQLPVLAALLLFYPEEYVSIFLVYVAGCTILITVILAKYSAWPAGMNLPQVFFIALSLYFPPLLLAVTPYFYYQSVKHLKQYLV